MMTDNIKYVLSFIQKYFCRFIFVFSLVFSVLTPSFGNAALLEFGDTYSHDEYLSYCGKDAFEAKYNDEAAKCWPCQVVKALTKALFMGVNRIIDNVYELSELILLLGAAIWLSMYFLKSLSSMAMQDSAKNLNGIFVFMFKVAFMFVLIKFGISEIILWIVKPLLSIGMDVSDVLKDMGRV